MESAAGYIISSITSSLTGIVRRYGYFYQGPNYEKTS